MRVTEGFTADGVNALMNICFICKYPPIQGGVSMHGYWAARGLAERGHRVFVVTNANEVESTFRIQLSSSDKSPGGDYARTFSESAGQVQVFSTEPLDHRRIYYIPMGNPTVTQLATLATDVIRQEQCRVIFSYYFEPYGVAAYLASRWTNTPYILKHAGSDLNRLLPTKELKTAYLEVLKGANRVISRGASLNQLVSLGIPIEKIDSEVAFGVPTDYFRPTDTSPDMNVLLSKIRTELPDYAACCQPLDEPLPILGIYGKLGEFKGSFDLLNAMSELVRGGFRFYLAAMAHGWQEPRFRKMANELGLDPYIRFLPFLPHWRVPSFIQSCSAIAFLERDFPISAHTPTIPSEIVACGKCLVLSEEVARKQYFRTAIRNRKNIIIVTNPKDALSLKSGIRFALEDEERAHNIGLQGLADFGVGHAHHEYIDAFENLLNTVADESPGVPAPVPNPQLKARADVLEIAEQFFPHTTALMTVAQRTQLENSIGGTAFGKGITDRIELAVQLGERLLAILSADGESGSLTRDVCLYEYKGYAWCKRPVEPPRPDKDLVFSAEALSALYPQLRSETELVEFSHDVEAVCNFVKRGDPPPRESGHITVLFHSAFSPMRVNKPTAELVRLLSDGTMTMAEILTVLGAIYDADGTLSKAAVESVLEVLESLYWEGLIEFGHQPVERRRAVAAA